MQVVTGLFDGMVLQRTAGGVSDAVVAGTCDGTGRVFARVTAQGRAVRGFAAANAGKADGRRFSARLRGIPAGGPYEIELTIRGTGYEDRVHVRDVCVGDVWLLGGQSNMEGIGLLRDAADPHPDVRAFYMDDRWAVARDPLHDLSVAVDLVHRVLCGGVLPERNPHAGVGPGLVFGLEMRRVTGVPQGLIACAHGGTSMSQWDPARKRDGNRSLYGAMVRRLRKNGGRVAGLVWYQGESDANAAAAPLYTRRMKTFVNAVRRDCGDARLPVAIVQIARVVGWGADQAVWWNSIQEQERLLPGVIPRLATVPAIDLTLDDGIHISGRGHKQLGLRLAEAMRSIVAGANVATAPIAVGRIEIRQASRPGFGDVVVHFRNVVGALCAGSRPVGFTLGDVGGNANQVFDCELDGSKAIVHTGMHTRVLEGRLLSYGAGVNPVCNIGDEGGRSLPVFGPLFIGAARLVTPYCQRFRISPILPLEGAVSALAYPSGMIAAWKERVFETEFANRHPEIFEWKGGPGVVYYACAFTVSRPMRLAALLGYDGPLKIWLDGQPVCADDAGTNPAVPGERVVPLGAGVGRHELVLAMGTNMGRAWGIFLQLERVRVSKRELARGARSVALPEWQG